MLKYPAINVRDVHKDLAAITHTLSLHIGPLRCEVQTLSSK